MQVGELKAQSTLDAHANSSANPLMLQCGLSHSHQQVPFACISRVRPVWIRPKVELESFVSRPLFSLRFQHESTKHIKQIFNFLAWFPVSTTQGNSENSVCVLSILSLWRGGEECGPPRLLDPRLHELALLAIALNTDTTYSANGSDHCTLLAPGKAPVMKLSEWKWFGFRLNSLNGCHSHFAAF